MYKRKYSDKALAQQLRKMEVLCTWCNAVPEDAGINSLLVRRGLLTSRKAEKESGFKFNILTDDGIEFLEHHKC